MISAKKDPSELAPSAGLPSKMERDTTGSPLRSNFLIDYASVDGGSSFVDEPSNKLQLKGK